MNKIAVFCGSSMGNCLIYKGVAEGLAGVFVDRQITLVYGGATVGLMGVLADAVISKGGTVIGVIPKLLSDIEIAHQGINQLHIVNSMHERKALIAELADAFILLPGGAGSLDEFFEIYTWAQLDLHKKPCGILNINNYYDHLIAFLDHAVREGFLKQENRDMVLIDSLIENLLEKFANYEPPAIGKWIPSKKEKIFLS